MFHPEWVSKRSTNNVSPIEARELDRLYWHRAMLEIVESKYTGGPQLTIMTYNLLYSASDTQYDYPVYTREEICFKEIIRYNPDIVCLQEVGNVQWLLQQFESKGYQLVAAHVNKYHSLAVAYKSDLFNTVHYKSDYLSLESDNETFQTQTYGTLFLCLSFKQEFLQGHTKPSKDALIVGTTHLPSRKFSSISRTKKAAALLQALTTFSESIRDTHENCYEFIAGDFNSIPDDPIYQSLVNKPVEYSRYAHDILIRSKHPYLKTDIIIQSPKSISIVGELEALHNNILKRAISLYSLGYGFVDSAHIQPRCNEPWVSHWGFSKFQELLDYIFVITDWDGVSSTQINYLEDFNDITQLKLLALLQMPISDDFPEDKKTQPYVGYFPSDHVCMMAALELL